MNRNVVENNPEKIRAENSVRELVNISKGIFYGLPGQNHACCLWVFDLLAGVSIF
jgi:hypothetical protein